MIRDVELLKHLPLFVQEYREIRTIMNAENPEFQIAEDETEVIFNNQFIKSCNLKGIARFESLMGIVPEPDDTLASRISRVLTRWNDTVPYTFIVLCERLDTLCGKDNYEIERDINNYTMDITTHLELVGQTDELEYMLGYMIPANIAMTVQNKIYLDMTDGTAKVASGITFCNIIELTDSFQEDMGIESDSNIAGAVVDTVSIEITDNFREDFEIESDSQMGSNLSLTEIIEGDDI